MIWIIFGAMAVATFLSVGRILADADPRAARTPIRAMAFIVWIVGLLLTLSGKVFIGLGVMAIGAFGLGAVSGGFGNKTRPSVGRRPQNTNSGFREGNRRRGPTGGSPDFESYANARARRDRLNSRPGVMSEQEAYEILGLQPGASAEEIARAHRTLMKKVHPDQGGTTELAARVNAAKDVLVTKSHG